MVIFSTISRLIVLENLAVRPASFTTADHVYGVVWASSLLMSMVAVGLWYGQA
jgi:hypothetical protein